MHLGSLLPIYLLATLQPGFAANDEFSVVAIVDCDQKARAVVVETLRDRDNIGNARIRQMAKSQLISAFLSSESHKRAILLHSRTKTGSRSQGIWIRDGKIRYEGKNLEVGTFLERLDLHLPDQKEEAEVGAGQPMTHPESE